MKKSVLRVAIWDFSPEDFSVLEDFFDEFVAQKAFWEFCVDRFDCCEKILDKLNSGVDYDLFLLGDKTFSDDCLDLCKEIRCFSDGEIVLFKEPCNVAALKAFSLNVAKYVVKPIDRFKFFDCLDRVLSSMDLGSASSFVVKSKEGIFRIPIYKILYVDTKNHVVFYHLIDGRIIASMTIRESFDSYVVPLMSDGRFLRSHYSFVVNLDYVRDFSGKFINLVNGESLPVSNSKLDDTKTRCFARVCS